MDKKAKQRIFELVDYYEGRALNNDDENLEDSSLRGFHRHCSRRALRSSRPAQRSFVLLFYP